MRPMRPIFRTRTEIWKDAGFASFSCSNINIVDSGCESEETGNSTADETYDGDKDG